MGISGLRVSFFVLSTSRRNITRRKAIFMTSACIIISVIWYSKMVNYRHVKRKFAANDWKLIQHYTPYFFGSYEYWIDFSQCPPGAQKCAKTEDFYRADAVLFHGPDMWPWPLTRLPPEKLEKQTWIFYSQESPATTLWNAQRFNGQFNWTMSHQRNSDIAMPYTFVTKWMKKVGSNISAKNYHRGKKKLAYIVTSNCQTFSKRMEFIAQMQQHAPGEIDVFGGCGISCPDKCDFKKMSSNYFYHLSFENSLCMDYITEKFFKNGLTTDAVPVVRGGLTREDYELKAPPNSFIYADDFPNAEKLVEEMKRVSQNVSLYNSYLSWKTTYEPTYGRRLNQFSKNKQWSQPLCDLCAALHNKSLLAEGRVHKRLDNVWNPRKNCRDTAFQPNEPPLMRLVNYIAYSFNIY